MRKTILSLLGSTLIVASMANAAMAAERHTRHHKTYTSQGARNAYGWQNRNALASENRTVVWPKDQNVFGRDAPWPTGRILPDDPRQFGNY
jgi:Ni/Co efflux regulator RcnB